MKGMMHRCQQLSDHLLPRVLATLLLLVCAGQLTAATANFAVAANFHATAEEIAEAFHRVSVHRVVFSFGSTGSLYAQIRHGAPFDALLAADAATPQLLEKNAMSIAQSRFTYALGKLVLWSYTEGWVDNRGRVIHKAAHNRLAIANPELAPYGIAAMQVLDSLALQQQWQGKLIMGNTITQAYQFVVSGNAQLGFVAASQVFMDNQLISGSAWVVPAQLYQPIRQQAVLLPRGAGNPAAEVFFGYLQSPAAIRIIRRRGYGVESTHAQQSRQ